MFGLGALQGAMGSVFGGGEGGAEAMPGDMSSRSRGTFSNAPKIVGSDGDTKWVLLAVAGVLAIILLKGKRG